MLIYAKFNLYSIIEQYTTSTPVGIFEVMITYHAEH